MSRAADSRDSRMHMYKHGLRHVQSMALLQECLLKAPHFKFFFPAFCSLCLDCSRCTLHFARASHFCGHEGNLKLQF